ncbi:CALML3 [Branchiostoma lanceolatum]|uniref:CALML3 protein n=1 Tax=Branchiostoma lanceolatum TaxID=7740 RepID=A0A8J9ZT58_BRALA|nr:CALML3 [Branchiostoma lanceolatum]
MATRQLTKEEIDQINQFLLNDKDGSGTVKAQEIIDFRDAMGVDQTEEEKQKYRDWVKSIDSNGDGAVSVEEFLAMMDKNISLDSPLEYFKFFDKDGSGFITKDEIRQAMSEMGQELSDTELESMMEKYDTSADGNINYEEFLKSLV